MEFEIVINFSLRLNNKLKNNTWFYKTDITPVRYFTTHIKNIYTSIYDINIYFTKIC